MISMFQSLYKNLARIRLFDNNGILELDESRIEIITDGTTKFMFVPENLCLFRVYSDGEKNNSANGYSVNKALQIGLLPARGAVIKRINEGRNSNRIGIHFFITSRCNMQCAYCVFRNGEILPIKDQFSFDAICDKILQVISITRPDEIDFTFTGGEPLLQFDRIVLITNYVESYCLKEGLKYTFQITTNGSIVSPEILLFMAQKKMKVTISLDGHKAWYKSSNDSRLAFFDTIIKNYEMIKKICVCNIRATIESNPKCLYERLRFLYSLSPNSLIIQPDILNKVSDETIRTLFEMDQQDFSSNNRVINYNVRKIFKILENFDYRDYGCGIGSTFFGINNKGVFIPCSFYNGMQNQAFDSIEKMLKYNGAIISRLVAEKDECKSCFSRHLCGGGCAYINTLNRLRQLKDSVKQSTCGYNKAALLYVIRNYEKLRLIINDEI